MPDDGRYSINFNSPVAVYAQIENQVLFEIASGRLKAGDLVPSGRELSVRLGVNANTVMKAYRDLEILGIVSSRRGVGVTVRDGAPKIARERAESMVLAHLCEAVAECAAAGIKAAKISVTVASALQAEKQPYKAR